MANDKKTELLGLNFSSASSSLRKQIIFHLAGALYLLSCYRCGKIIELENFSIDHKDSWMQAEDPKQSFFDMNNIAFSHVICNSGAGFRMKSTEEERRTKVRNRSTKRRQNEPEEIRKYKREYMKRCRASAQG